MTTNYTDSMFTLNSTDAGDYSNSSADVGEGPNTLAHDILWKVLDGLIGSLGIFGNGLVIYVFMRRITLRNLVNLFIINQSLIDFTTSMVFICLHLGPSIKLIPGDRVDLFVCRLWVSEYVMWALFISSSINLMNITLERYFAIMMPQRYRRLVGTVKKRIVPFAAATWAFGFIIDSYWAVIHEVFIFPGMPGPEGICIPNWESTVLQGFVGILIFFVTYLCPLSLMLFTYYQIIRQLRRQDIRMGSTQRSSKSPLRTASVSATVNGSGQQGSPATQRSRKFQRNKSIARTNAKKNVIKTMASVSTVYGICWAPIAFNYLVYNLGGPLDFFGTWYAVTKVFAYANMCANPFIYTMQYRQFQEGLKKTFGISTSQVESVDLDGTSAVPTNDNELTN